MSNATSAIGDDGDACTNACQNARCGDGRIQAGREECDDNGFSGDGDACDDQCRTIECGNGRTDTGEECDDGDMNGESARCLLNCTRNQCGDGFVHDGVEECDDGNDIDSDACTNACGSARCGDGIVQRRAEECDDGNRVDDDGCTNDCTIPACGDGVVQDGEACDDGNRSDEDDCLNDCTLAMCGDNIINWEQEACDDGNRVNDDACTNRCAVATCGDGVCRSDIPRPTVDEFEYCDDGNDDEYDGCNTDCEQTESEPNDNFGGPADVINYGQVRGVMEAGSDNRPGLDSYRFELRCGVEDGADCPPGGEVTWNFNLYTPQNLCGRLAGACPVSGFRVNAACEDMCPPPPTLRFTRHPRGLGTLISWSYVGDRAGTWEFQLQSSRQAAFDYRLRVTVD